MRGDVAASILMVDDDPHVLRSLRAALESHGYRVRTAASGPIALEACAEERPDVVLLDLALPGLDGVEVCKRLRSWSRVPILVLSARVHEAQKVQARCLATRSCAFNEPSRIATSTKATKSSEVPMAVTAKEYAGNSKKKSSARKPPTTVTIAGP